MSENIIFWVRVAEVLFFALGFVSGWFARRAWLRYRHDKITWPK